MPGGRREWIFGRDRFRSMTWHVELDRHGVVDQSGRSRRGRGYRVAEDPVQALNIEVARPFTGAALVALLKGPGPGSSEDDRGTRHPRPADSWTRFVSPGRQSPARPAAADPGRWLRVRGRDPGTVRGIPAGEGRQGPAPAIRGQGGRPLTRAGHPPGAQHRTTGAITAAAPGAPSPAATSRPISGCSPKSMSPRHPLRAGHPPALRPRLARVRRPPSALPPSPTDTSTTCAARPLVNAAAGRCPRHPRSAAELCGGRRGRFR